MPLWSHNGKAGSAFVNELSRLFGAASTLESVAMKAATVLPILETIEDFEKKGTHYLPTATSEDVVCR